MAQGNTLTITGNVTRDPELKFTPSGTAVASFGLAWNRRVKKGDEWVDEPNYFDVTVWQDLAENVAASCPKGTRVTIEGRLDHQTWETPEGDKRSKVAIVADEVAVNLRWATVDNITRVTKADRQGGGQSKPAARKPEPALDLDGPDPFADEPF